MIINPLVVKVIVAVGVIAITYVGKKVSKKINVLNEKNTNVKVNVHTMKDKVDGKTKIE